MAHKMTGLKFNQREAVDLWDLLVSRLWPKITFMSQWQQRWQAQQCGGISPWHTLKMSHPEGTQKQELRGCKQTFNGLSHYVVEV